MCPGLTLKSFTFHKSNMLVIFKKKHSLFQLLNVKEKTGKTQGANCERKVLQTQESFYGFIPRQKTSGVNTDSIKD